MRSARSTPQCAGTAVRSSWCSCRDTRSPRHGGLPKNIRQAVYDYRYVNEQALPGGRLSASLGVTSYRPGVASAQQLAQEADSAMYRAKNAGRNRVELFPGIAEEP